MYLILGAGQDVEIAQEILIKHWNKIRVFPKFVQIALFLATPDLIKLANNAIATAIDKAKMLEGFSFTVGFMRSGSTGLTRGSQLEALKPHINLLSENDLFSLWNECRAKNWKRFCHEYLEPRLRLSGSKYSNHFRTKPPFDFSELEKFLCGEVAFTYLWLDKQIQRGGERDLLLSELLTWAEGKGTIVALDVVGNIYSKEASRSEFNNFEKIASTFPKSEDIISEVRFNIYYRALN